MPLGDYEGELNYLEYKIDHGISKYFELDIYCNIFRKFIEYPNILDTTKYLEIRFLSSNLDILDTTKPKWNRSMHNTDFTQYE